jgi:hypothetical protein
VSTLDTYESFDLESHVFEKLKFEDDSDVSNHYLKSADAIFERQNPVQKSFLRDKCRKKGLLAPRRTGKSWAICAKLFIQCLTVPYSNCVYATLTKGAARGILWALMHRYNDEFGLGIKFNNTNLTATFANKSHIALVGAENHGEIDKLRGQGYDIVCIDECKSFPADVLEEFIDEVIVPALLDRGGELILAGTPGAILQGPFYDVTCGRLGVTHKRFGAKWEKGKRFEYSVHKWKLSDNTSLPDLEKDATEWKDSKGLADDDPRWIREYLGEWIASDDALVYKYNKYGDGRNDFIPRGVKNYGLQEEGYEYILGIDIGFDDPTAFVVIACKPTDRNLYVLHGEKTSHLTVPEIADKIIELQNAYGGFAAIVCDFGGLGKTVWETIMAQYGIPLIPAKKSEKLDYIELLNSDFLGGFVKIKDGTPLATELKTLQFDHTGIKEHPSCPNHLCDALLYVWRYSYHTYRESATKEPTFGTREYWELKDQEAFNKACAKRTAPEVLDSPVNFYEYYDNDTY